MSANIRLAVFKTEADKVIAQLEQYSTNWKHCDNIEHLTFQIELLTSQLRSLEEHCIVQGHDQITLLERSLRSCHEKISRLLGDLGDNGRAHLIQDDFRKAERSLQMASGICLALEQSWHRPQKIVTYTNMIIRDHARVHNGDVFGNVNFSNEQLKIVDRKQRPRRRQRGEYCIRIKPWFMARIWDFSFSLAAGGWDNSLRTWYKRASDSDIFFLLERQDFRRARELISLGRASHFDLDPSDQSIAEIAIHKDGLEFCLENLRMTRPSLCEFHTLWHMLMCAERCEYSVEDAYRMILTDTHWDFGEEAKCAISELRLDYISPKGHLILQRGLLLHGLESASVATEFDRKWKWDKAVSIKSDGLFDHELCFRRDEKGCTVLHYLAARIGHSYRRTQAQELLRSLVEAGADLHAQDNNGLTPLQHFVKRCLKGLNRLELNSWACYLSDAGVDLISYGRREIEIWSSFKVELFEDDAIVKVSGLAIDKSPLLWSVNLRFATLVPVYKRVARDLPGAWPSDRREQYLPRTLCWDPDETDSAGDDFQDWRFERSIKVWLSASPVKTDPETSHLRQRTEDDSGDCARFALRGRLGNSSNSGTMATAPEHVDTVGQYWVTRLRRSVSQPRLGLDKHPRITAIACCERSIPNFCLHQCTLGSRPEPVIERERRFKGCSYGCLKKPSVEEDFWEQVWTNMLEARREYRDKLRYERLCEEIDADYAARYHT